MIERLLARVDKVIEWDARGCWLLARSCCHGGSAWARLLGYKQTSGERVGNDASDPLLTSIGRNIVSFAVGGHHV